MFLILKPSAQDKLGTSRGFSIPFPTSVVICRWCLPLVIAFCTRLILNTPFLTSVWRGYWKYWVHCIKFRTIRWTFLQKLNEWKVWVLFYLTIYIYSKDWTEKVRWATFWCIYAKVNLFMLHSAVRFLHFAKRMNGLQRTFLVHQP